MIGTLQVGVHDASLVWIGYERLEHYKSAFKMDFWLDWTHWATEAIWKRMERESFWRMSDWDFQVDEAEQDFRDEKTRIVSTEWSEEQSELFDIIRDSQCYT